ncbi:MAG: hypothetical protein ACTSX7_01620, partial [Alphaproteobacteria bacterium]
MSRVRGGLAAGLWAVLLIGSGAPVLAAERVAIRAWPHAEFVRLVFDWKSPIIYTTQIEDRVLSVTFERDLETSFSEVAANLADHVSETEITNDGRTVRFTLNGNYELRHFVADGSVVLDLLERPTEAKASTGVNVPVRVGEHAKFSRVVFDWPSIVDYEVEESAGAVTVRFSRPATLDLASFNNPPRDIAGAKLIKADDGTVLAIEISPSSRVRHFRDGFKVVLDVQRQAVLEQAEKTAVAAPIAVAEIPPAPPEPEPIVQTAPTPPEQDAVAAPTPLVGAESIQIASTEHGASVTSRDDEAVDHVDVHDVAIATSSAGATSATSAAVANSAHEATGTPITLTPGRHGGDRPATPAEVPVRGHGVVEVADSTNLDVEIQALDVTFTRVGDGGVLSFPFERHTGAAAFRRSGQLWLVFDSPAEVDTDEIFTAAQDVLLGVEAVPLEGGLALRLDTIPGFNPTLEVDGTEWLVKIRPRTLEPTVAAEVSVTSDSDGNVVVVPLRGAGRRFSVPDPVMGDDIAVVTSNVPGIGVSKERSFVGFVLVESAQGVAVVGLRDGIQVLADKQGVTVSVTGGLAITSTEEREQIKQAAGGADVVPRIFEFVKWRGEDGHYLETKQALQHQISTTDGDKRNAARLDLAQFYFGHGQAERVLGVLDAITREAAALSRSPEFKSLRGAAAYLMNRFDIAASDLADRRLDTEPEIDLWRSALSAARGDWLGASRGLQDSELYVQRYPDGLRARFSLLGAVASLHVDDPTGALAWLESLGGLTLSAADLGQATVLRGQVLAANGHVDEAIEKFDIVIAGEDRKSRAMAMFERANLMLEAEDADKVALLGDLDRLRFAWRGDDMEFDVLRRLGELQIESEDYRGGLKTLKRAAENYAKHPDADGLTELMQATFGDLYLHGRAEEMPAVRAIAIFNEFRELTPTGSEGDEMIRRLADRLVSVDLLDQAGELLSHQMEFRVEGAEKASVGTRLAILKLMDRRPEDALEALRDSDVLGMSAALLGERQLLEARSYAELGQIDKALERIEQDRSAEADRLRADIFMRTLDWRRAAKVLTRLVGAVPAQGQMIEPGSSLHVLNLAVALNLAGDKRGLDDLRARFSAAMEATEYAYDFRV